MKSKNNVDKRVIELTQEYHRRAEKRKNVERNWTLNVNFYNGNQYAEVLPTGEICDASKRYFWEQTNVYNHVAPIIDARLAKFNGVKAEVSVKPSGNEQSDRLIAEFSTKLLKSVKQNLNFKKLRRIADYWAEITGSAFYKIGWDKTAGLCLSKEKNIYEGEGTVTVCPPYEIFPDDLTASDIEDCRSIIHAKVYPIEIVEQKWGVKVDPEQVTIMQLDGQTSYIGDFKFGAKRAISNEVEGYVTVIEEYVKPNANYPDGRLLIVAGDQVLYDGILPYINGKNGTRIFPFVKQVALSAPASFFGSSLIERLIPVQRAYNAIKNRKHEFFSRMTAGVLMAEDGSIDVDNLEDEGISPGKVILYRQGAKAPEMLNFGSVPSEFSEEEDKLLNEFVSVSGVSDYITNNSQYGRNLTATALSLIIEQDNNRLCVTTDSIRNASKEVSEQLLRLYKQFAGEGRLIKIAGDNGGYEIRAFKTCDVNSDEIEFDVADESLNTVSNKTLLLESVFKTGLLQGDDGKISSATRKKMLNMIGLDTLYDYDVPAEELHRNKADDENQIMELYVPEIDVLDNHKIHLEEHKRYAISIDKESNAYKNLYKHIALHENKLK